jgi:hypothetical protein
MPKIKDSEIKKLSLPSKKELMTALERVIIPKPSPKQSKT